MKIDLGDPSSFGRSLTLSKQSDALSTASNSFNGDIGSLAALTAGRGVIGKIIDYLETSEKEETKRAAINAQRDVELSKIRAQRKILSKAVDKKFSERAVVLGKTFESFDRGVSNGDLDLVKLSLDAMVEIVKSPPSIRDVLSSESD